MLHWTSDCVCFIVKKFSIEKKPPSWNINKTKGPAINSNAPIRNCQKVETRSCEDVGNKHVICGGSNGGATNNVDEEDSDSDDESEEIKAPNELLMEVNDAANYGYVNV